MDKEQADYSDTELTSQWWKFVTQFESVVDNADMLQQLINDIFPRHRLALAKALKGYTNEIDAGSDSKNKVCALLGGQKKTGALARNRSKVHDPFDPDRTATGLGSS